jgi:hypothetical protein
MTEPEPQPDPVAALLHGAVDLDEAERLAARSQFLQRLDRRLERSTSAKLIRYGAPLALAASVLLALSLWKLQPSLEYTVQGAVRDGNYVQAAQDRPADISFSDRTQIHASPGARLRIDDDAGGNGARVSVERGELEVEVAHTERTNWRFAAGPFNVRVTGTRLVLNWDANTERLEVVMHTGSVDIEGYVGSGVLSVRAGQRFLGDAKRRTMLVTDIDGARAPSAASASLPAIVSGSAPSPSSPVRSPPAPSSKASWTELVSKGAFRQVVDEATARGTSDCLASCSPDDLSALADAARYVGRGDLAEPALLAIRSRHVSAHGVRAAFLLGRLHESKGSMASAKSWYETALREGPGGAFAAEALAGKMRAVNALEGRAAARTVAQEYLRRHPKGVHAAAARQLVEIP